MTLSGPTADGRLRDVILELSARLASLLEDDIDAGIEVALGEVGAFTDVDRAYVMTFHDATFSNTHEWVATGVSAEKLAIQGVSIARLGAWLPAFARGDAVRIPTLTTLHASPDIIATFQQQAIRSMLWVPMPGPLRPLGFVGFDSVRSERAWTDEEVTLLRAVANVFAAALERRDAVRERDEVARRLTALAALVPGVVYQLHMDAHGTLRFPYASPGILSVFGVDPEDVTADASVAFSRVHPDDLAELEASIEHSRASLGEWVQEFRMHHPVAGTRWVRAHAAPERMPDGGTLWHGVVTDTTESRLMEEALRRDVVERERARAVLEREVAFRRALVDVTNDMLAASLGDDFYQEVLERTISLVPDAQGGSIVLRDDDGLYRYVAAVGFDLGGLLTIRLSEAELARAIPPAVERVYVRESPNVAPERREGLERAGRLAEIEVTLSIPIVVAGEVKGFMNLDNFDDRDAFETPARSTAQALAAQVAVALQRLHLERDLRLERARYERLASHDSLTNLPNRRLFQDRLEQAITHAHRRRERVALIYLDLDGFKHVNDTLGHDVGDELLEAVAARLVMAVRAADTVARLGGDEFAIVLQEIGSDRDAQLVAEKLLEAFDAPFVLRGRSLAVGASIGVAIYPRDARLTDALMKAADLAMYRVKEAGRGDYAFFSA